MAQEAIHEEIKWLERELEARKKELETRGETKPEKEVFHDVLKEAISSPTPPPAGGSAPISDYDAQQAAYQLKEKEHAHIIEKLIGLALAKGLNSAVKIASSMKNPHILDEFHDALADKYYEKLLESRKLK